MSGQSLNPIDLAQSDQTTQALDDLEGYFMSVYEATRPQINQAYEALRRECWANNIRPLLAYESAQLEVQHHLVRLAFTLGVLYAEDSYRLLANAPKFDR